MNSCWSIPDQGSVTKCADTPAPRSKVFIYHCVVLVSTSLMDPGNRSGVEDVHGDIKKQIAVNFYVH